VLDESSFFERLAKLVCVLSVTERTGTQDRVTPDAPTILAPRLYNRVLSEFFECVVARLDAVVLREGVQVCVGEFVGLYCAGVVGHVRLFVLFAQFARSL